MKALILAAGYGTRLYPHTKNLPKPLLKVGKKPIINHLLEKVEELNNVSRIVVVTNNRFFKQFQTWKNSLPSTFLCGKVICLLNDLTTCPEDKLGAIGDMHFAFEKERFKGNFLILGGDNLFKGSMEDFMHFAQSKHPHISIGLFDINDRQEARRYGVVTVDRTNRVVEFCEKPAKPKSTLVAMCLYYIPQKKLQLIKEYLSNPLNSRDTAGSYLSWLIRKVEVYGFKFSDSWFDIGHIHTYMKVKKDFKG